jgi:predicted nucleic acid-binding protein
MSGSTKVSARLDTGLLAAAKAKIGAQSDTEVLTAALAVVAGDDDFGAWLVSRGGGGFPRTSSLSSDLVGPAPFESGALTATFAYRPRDLLPYEVASVAANAIFMLDATVYIDAQALRLPKELAARIASSEILHCAVAVGELAATLGLLDPKHPGTPSVQHVIKETLERIYPIRTVAPSPAAWKEASIIAGALARTQHLQKDGRRKLLNDALLYISAEETGTVLVSRNARDMDLLLQVRPLVEVLLYGRP